MAVSGAVRVTDPDYRPKSGYGLWANPEPEPGQGPPTGEATFNTLTLSNNFLDIQNTTDTFKIHRNP